MSLILVNFVRIFLKYNMRAKLHFILYACALGMAGLMTASCNLNTEEKDYAEFINLVNIINENEDGSKYHFLTDNDIVLNPTVNKTSIKGVRDGQRSAIYFKLIEGQDEKNSKELDIMLFDCDTLVIDCATASVATTDGLKEFGDEPLNVQYYGFVPNTTAKHFNLYIQACATNIRKHNFTLVHVEEKDNVDEIHFYLRHDLGKDEYLINQWHWISCPFEPFLDDFAGRKTAIIHYIGDGFQDNTVTLQLPGQK